MRNYLIFPILGVLLSLVFILAGCGGGTTGSGEAYSGSVLTVEYISGYYNDDYTDEVDVWRDPDCNDDGKTDDPEFYSNHDAAIKISNKSRPNEPGTATDIVIEKYTIEYRISETDAPGAPVLSSRTVYQTLYLPADEEPEEQYIDLVDLDTKSEFRTQWEQGSHDPFQDLPVRYQVFYTFYGQNVFGKDVTITANINITIGDYDYCE